MGNIEVLRSVLDLLKQHEYGKAEQQISMVQERIRLKLLHSKRDGIDEINRDIYKMKKLTIEISTMLHDIEKSPLLDLHGIRGELNKLNDHLTEVRQEKRRLSRSK